MRQMSANPTTEELQPTNPAVQEATRALLERRDDVDVQEFLEKLGADTPSPIGATVDLKIAVWGKLHVEPDGQPWVWDSTVWGAGAYIGSAVGFMYTAYDSWDAFFQNCTAVHVQGIDVGGGILQVNWFNSSGVPVGQFNGAAAGAGAIEGGGSGKWTHK
jgi:hypothetical protein